MLEVLFILLVVLKLVLEGRRRLKEVNVSV